MDVEKSLNEWVSNSLIISIFNILASATMYINSETKRFYS